MKRELSILQKKALSRGQTKRNLHAAKYFIYDILRQNTMLPEEKHNMELALQFISSTSLVFDQNTEKLGFKKKKPIKNILIYE